MLLLALPRFCGVIGLGCWATEVRSVRSAVECMKSSISQFRGIVCMDIHNHREPWVLLGNLVIRLPERNGGILSQIRDRTLLSLVGGGVGNT